MWPFSPQEDEGCDERCPLVAALWAMAAAYAFHLAENQPFLEECRYSPTTAICAAFPHAWCAATANDARRPPSSAGCRSCATPASPTRTECRRIVEAVSAATPAACARPRCRDPAP